MYRSHVSVRWKKENPSSIQYSETVTVACTKFSVASHVIVSTRVPSFQAEVRNLVNKCIYRLHKVENNISDSLLNPALNLLKDSCSLRMTWKRFTFIVSFGLNQELHLGVIMTLLS